MNDLEAPKLVTKIEYVHGDNEDIQKVLSKNFPIARQQVKKFSKRFKGRNLEDTSRNVWKFLKENIRYVADDEVGTAQNIKLPSRLIHDGTGDCKSFSLFAASIMSWYAPVAFVYTAYTTRWRDGKWVTNTDTTPSHVYVMVDGKILIDAVWNKFNSEKKNILKKYISKMQINTLAGFGKLDSVNKYPVDRYTFALIKNHNNAIKTLPVGHPVRKHLEKRLKEVINAAGVNGQSIDGLKKVFTAVHTVVNKVTTNATTAAQKAAAAVKTGTNAVKNAVQSGNPGLAVKTVALAPGRADFLILLKLNFRGIATRLSEMPTNEVNNFWLKLGGDTTAIQAAINNGKSKKPLFGAKKQINGIGIGGPEAAAAVVTNPEVLTALITSAASVIAAVVGFLKKNGKDVPGDTGGDIGTDEFPDISPTGDTIPSDFGTGEDHPILAGSGGGGISPMLLIAGAGAAFFLLKK